VDTLSVKVITSANERLVLNPNEIDIAVMFDDNYSEISGATLLVTYFPDIQRRFVAPEFVRSGYLETEGFQSFACSELKAIEILVLKLEILFPDKKVIVVV